MEGNQWGHQRGVGFDAGTWRPVPGPLPWVTAKSHSGLWAGSDELWLTCLDDYSSCREQDRPSTAKEGLQEAAVRGPKWEVVQRADVTSFQPSGLPEGPHSRRETQRGRGCLQGLWPENEDRAAAVEAVRTAGGSEVRSSLWDVLGWRHPWTPRWLRATSWRSERPDPGRLLPGLTKWLPGSLTSLPHPPALHSHYSHDRSPQRCPLPTVPRGQGRATDIVLGLGAKRLIELPVYTVNGLQFWPWGTSSSLDSSPLSLKTGGLGSLSFPTGREEWDRGRLATGQRQTGHGWAVAEGALPINEGTNFFSLPGWSFIQVETGKGAPAWAKCSDLKRDWTRMRATLWSPGVDHAGVWERLWMRRKVALKTVHDGGPAPMYCSPFLYARTLSRTVVSDSASPRTVAHQSQTLSVEFSRQKYCSELLFSSPTDLPDPGIEPRSPALQADSLQSELPDTLHWVKD